MGRRLKHTCQHCQEFFAQATCGKLRGYDECDCPRCQGYCECPDPDLLRDDKLERDRSWTRFDVLD